MLDVHAPHDKVHSWRDFFVHVATISVGLVIALGLENLAEYLHHRHQLLDARHDLGIEVEHNRQGTARNLTEAEAIIAKLDANMLQLRASQASASRLAGALDYETTHFSWPAEGTWQVVRQNGSLGLMPHNEVVGYVYLYEAIAAVKERMMALSAHARLADAILHRAPDGHLMPGDIAELITATSSARGEASFLLRLLEIEKADLASIAPTPNP